VKNCAKPHHFKKNRSHRPQICFRIVLLKSKYLWRLCPTRSISPGCEHYSCTHAPCTTGNRKVSQPTMQQQGGEQNRNQLRKEQQFSSRHRQQRHSLPIFRVALASDTVSSRFCGLRSRWIRCRLHKNSSPLAGEHEEVSTRAMQAAELSFSQLHTTAPSWHMKLVETGSDKVLFVLMNLWRSPPPQYSNRR
jgi:hypothetical protein